MNTGNRSAVFFLTIGVSVFSLFIGFRAPTYASNDDAEELTTTENSKRTQKKMHALPLASLGIGGLSLLGMILSYQAYNSARKESDSLSPLTLHNDPTSAFKPPVVQDAPKANLLQEAPAVTERHKAQLPHANDRSTLPEIRSTVTSQNTVQITINTPLHLPAQNVIKITVSSPKRVSNDTTVSIQLDNSEKRDEATQQPSPRKKKRLDFDTVAQSSTRQELPKTVQHRPSLPSNLRQDIAACKLKLYTRRSSLGDKTPPPKTYIEALAKTLTARRKFIAIDSPAQELVESPLHSPALGSASEIGFKTPPKLSGMPSLTKEADRIASKAKAAREIFKPMQAEKTINTTLSDLKSLLTAKNNLKKTAHKNTKGASSQGLSILGKAQRSLALLPPSQGQQTPCSPETNNWHDGDI